MAIDCIIQPHYSFVTMNLAVKACVFLLLENYTSMLNIMPITKFFDTIRELSKVQESTLFTVALSADGDQILAGGGSRIDAIKAEALAACKNGLLPQ